MKSLSYVAALASRASVAVLAGVVAACGGGGGGGGGTPASGGSESAVSSGVITGFGSVIVNGVRFDTSAASFTVDDTPGGQDDLGIGDVVTIRGTINADGRSGTATAVIGEDAVEGPVSSINLLAGTLVVAGQDVITDADTSFDDNIPGSSLAGLLVGQFVEVAGFFDSQGRVRATRIERKLAATDIEVHGTVANLQPGVSFTLNALTVNYGGALIDDSCTGGVIGNGDFVEAKGTSLSNSGALIATNVECKTPGDDDGDNGTRREIEGLVTRFASITDFDVAGRPVTTTGSTVYENGAAADVAVNVKVEVEGSLNGSGVLVARKVSLRRSSFIRVAATVQNKGSDSVTLLGITVKVDALTRLEDKSGADKPAFSLADVNVGDYLEVRGAELPAGSGQLLASRLEREDPDNRSIIQGPVTEVSQPDLGIFGVTVQTSGATEFESVADAPISASTFFGQVQAGDLVKARGQETSGSVIVADEVEFESD